MSVTEEDLCHHMKVVVRVRPENTKEKTSGFHKVVHVVDKHILVFDRSRILTQDHPTPKSSRPNMP